MAIDFKPQPGQILMCDFSTGFMRPEMQKIRHCIVVSADNDHGTCLVVPLSTQTPNPVRTCHYCIPQNIYPCIDCGTDVWAKADMLTHAAFLRLERPKENHRFVSRQLRKHHLAAILRAVMHALNCGHLTQHL